MKNVPYKTPEEIIDADKILDWIFKDSSVKYGLQEFSKDILKKINAFKKEDGRFYVRCLKRDKDIFIYDPNKKSVKPEEVIRQLWLVKLTKEYKYPLDRIEVEKSVQFGREVRIKAADIVLYKEDKITPYIIFELKQPDAKKAEEQLKSYSSAEGAEGGVWSNGTVVGLEGNTFKLPAPAKGTGTKTSVLFLQKWDENQRPLKDYPIFMAVSKKSGKDNSGEYVYLNEEGRRVKSEGGIFEAHENLRLNDDLDEIAEAFVKFAERQKFNFWR